MSSTRVFFTIHPNSSADEGSARRHIILSSKISPTQPLEAYLVELADENEIPQDPSLWTVGILATNVNGSDAFFEIINWSSYIPVQDDCFQIYINAAPVRTSSSSSSSVNTPMDAVAPTTTNTDASADSSRRTGGSSNRTLRSRRGGG